MSQVWLIHNNIPPYRVPLFAEIARCARFGFCVVLTAAKCRHRPHWQPDLGTLPFRVKVMKGLSIPLSDSDSVSVSLGLLPSLIRHRPDVVICSGFGLSTLLAFVYAKLFRRRFIVWSESTPITEELRHIGRMRRCLRRLLARHASAFVDAGTLAHDYIRSLLPAYAKPPFFRAYNSVDGSLFSSGPHNECALDASPSFRRILFVGRLNENKGIPMLLAVYEDVLKKSADPVHLVLVGDGPLRDQVEQYRKNPENARIVLYGQLPYCQVAQFYQSCDVFVLLSHSDCNPLVILEALHGGIPIVCTNRAGNAPDFVVSGENGYIVDPTDKDQIVTCVLDVLGWDVKKRANCRRISHEQVAKANYEKAAAAFVEACAAVLPKK